MKKQGKAFVGWIASFIGLALLDMLFNLGTTYSPSNIAIPLHIPPVVGITYYGLIQWIVPFIVAYAIYKEYIWKK